MGATLISTSLVVAAPVAGATDIRIGGVSLGNRVVVAGGGGGNGWDAPGPFAGGAGGGLNGGNSVPNISGSSALGGSQSGGGGHMPLIRAILPVLQVFLAWVVMGV